MRVVLLLGLIVLAGCATAGVASREALAGVEPGMTREALVARLGPPGNRTFRGSAEALQYCRPGFFEDEISTAWLVDGKVSALTTTARLSSSCTGHFPEIDWGQVPPDVRIALERR